MDKVIQFPERDGPTNMKGPERFGNDIIIDGRGPIPKMHMHDRGEEIDIILDGRLSFTFPREIAYHAANLAANAIAIGAGYAYVGAESKDRPFAPQCMKIELPY